MRQNFENIDQYIEQYHEKIQVILRKLRKTIREAAPEATEAIAYQMPTFRLNGNLVHFAAFNDHIGFFPTPSGINAYEKELAPYRTGKGTIRFKLSEPIPYDLVRKVVLSRVKENSRMKR